MIDLIALLMERGHAYVGGDGSVFFDARSFPGYGELSGNRLDDLRPGHLPNLFAWEAIYQLNH